MWIVLQEENEHELFLNPIRRRKSFDRNPPVVEKTSGKDVDIDLVGVDEIES